MGFRRLDYGLQPIPNLGQSINVPGLSWVLLGNFVGADISAGNVPSSLSVPYVDVGGPLSMVELDGSLSIASGTLEFGAQTTTSWTETGFYGPSFSRSPGVALCFKGFKMDTTLGGVIFGWHTSGTLSASIEHGLIWEGDSNVRQRTNSSTPIVFSYSLNAIYDIVMILRNTGQFIFFKGGDIENWKRVWIERTKTTAFLYPMLTVSRMSGTVFLDAVRIADLVANGYSVFSSDDADAEVSEATIDDSNQISFIHSSDFMARFTINTMPSTANGRMIFRNGCRLQIAVDGSGRIDKSNGAAIGTCAAGTFTAGAKVTVHISEDVGACFVGDTRVIYGTGLDNLNETSGSWLTRAGIYTNFKIWPVYPTGSVLNALKKLAG